MNEPLLTLCRWANTLNTWEWPHDFPIPKPEGFDDLRDRDREADTDKFRVMNPYIHALHIILPHKEVLRHWNTIHRAHGMTNEEFETWYDRPGDTIEADDCVVVKVKPAE